MDSIFAYKHVKDYFNANLKIVGLKVYNFIVRHSV